MSDLQTVYSGFLAGADLALDGLGLATDGGLGTAVVLSLFTDRQAAPDDVLPAGATDRRGWWGDVVPLADGYQLGSRLWLLGREKQLPEVLERAHFYAEEALTWLVTCGAAAAVRVDATNPAPGVLALAVTVTAPATGTQTYHYQWEWMRDGI